MKKLSFIFFVLSFVFVGCSDDDEAQFISNFEGKLAEKNTEYYSSLDVTSGSETFQDNDGLFTFNHVFNWYGGVYYFSAFTYMNRTDNTEDTSTTAVPQRGKKGSTYLCAFTSEWTMASFTINNPNAYTLKGAYVTNNTWAYNAMTTDKISGTTPFTKGDWFKLTATGYTSTGTETGTAEIYLANYTKDSSKPVDKWIWFDMTSLNDPVKVTFLLSSSDNGDHGMNTPAYFCMDNIVLEEKQN
ncbi:DUF4465 domain-containing protein [Bacteroides sp. 214]|uniref:DUF4465 domain-containing protein n=1 Tax=Bacteroides sp. 214 TaxID=2302935 RepID=UPI0013CF8E65|nr:DUF4465 domain-containing protein [Bacteroides sp. 214]NDW12629.1 DUF4465 domain-containing protein [Bacteroides sp. 214]